MRKNKEPSLVRTDMIVDWWTQAVTRLINPMMVHMARLAAESSGLDDVEAVESALYDTLDDGKIRKLAETAAEMIRDGRIDRADAFSRIFETLKEDGTVAGAIEHAKEMLS